MGALAQWNPQPVVPQPTFVPIRRQYQVARLHESLQLATNGGRINIFRVHGWGNSTNTTNIDSNGTNINNINIINNVVNNYTTTAIPTLPSHPLLATTNEDDEDDDDDDASGEPDSAILPQPPLSAVRRTGGASASVGIGPFSALPGVAQIRPSVAGHA